MIATGEDGWKLVSAARRAGSLKLEAGCGD